MCHHSAAGASGWCHLSRMSRTQCVCVCVFCRGCSRLHTLPGSFQLVWLAFISADARCLLKKGRLCPGFGRWRVGGRSHVGGWASLQQSFLIALLSNRVPTEVNHNHHFLLLLRAFLKPLSIPSSLPWLQKYPDPPVWVLMTPEQAVITCRAWVKHHFLTARKMTS